MTRGFGFFELVFFINLGVFIYKLNCKNLLKIVFVSSIFYFSVWVEGFLIASFLIASTLIIIYFYEKNDLFKKVVFKHLFVKSKNLSNIFVFLFFLCLTPGVLYLGYQKLDKEFSFYSLKKINKATIRDLKQDKLRLDAAISLRACDDFNLYDPIYGRQTSSIAGKSNFIGLSYFNNLDINLITEGRKRRKISENFQNFVNANSVIPENILRDFEKYEVVIITKEKTLSNFPKNVTYYKFL